VSKACVAAFYHAADGGTVEVWNREAPRARRAVSARIPLVFLPVRGGPGSACDENHKRSFFWLGDKGKSVHLWFSRKMRDGRV